MTPEATVERERRWARPVAIAAATAALLYTAALLIEQVGGLIDPHDNSTVLTSYHDHPGALLATGTARAIASLLLSVPLAYLFLAVRARNPSVRPALIGFAFFGPVLFAARTMLEWGALAQVGDQYVSRHVDSDVLAGILIDRSGLFTASFNLGFPAVLGLIIGLIYIPRQAMRAGLLTRFWGTLVMAFGAGLALFPPLALFGVMLWFLWFGLMIVGRAPGGRPPAWETGTAVPWMRPGVPAPQEEGAIEGRGAEVTSSASGDAAEDGAEAKKQAVQTAQRRKRKRRR